MPNAFSISFHCGVRGRGRADSSEASCTGNARNFAIRSGDWKTLRRVGGLPRSAACFNCGASVAQKMKSNASAECFEAAGTATSQEPSSPTPGARPAGMGANEILLTTLDFEGSSIAAIHAGQLMLMAAVDWRRCAETSSALNPAYPGGENF